MSELATIPGAPLARKANSHFTNVSPNSVLALVLTFLAIFIPTGNVVAAPGDNIALATAGGVATQATFFNVNRLASNCINGITSSNSNSQLCHTGRPPRPNEWWDLQLPTSVPIDSIVIHNRINCCTVLWST